MNAPSAWAVAKRDAPRETQGRKSLNQLPASKMLAFAITGNERPKKELARLDTLPRAARNKAQITSPGPHTRLAHPVEDTF